MRRAPTDAERSLWTLLRSRRFTDYKFRRQTPVGPFIVDFYCDKRRLAVELDGGQHLDMAEADQERTRFLNKMGVRVVRFFNHDVLNKKQDVLREILRNLMTPSPVPAGHPLPLGEGKT